mgnify:FL=1
MNNKALKTLEYTKIIEMLAAHASSPLGKIRCEDLLPSCSPGEIEYKQEQTQFKSLLYQNLQAKTTSANGENKPVGAQVGLGSRVSAVTSIYTQGALNATDSTTDFAINGDGFFAVRNTNTDETVYTRNGHCLLYTSDAADE